jgi:hypothetical protein
VIEKLRFVHDLVRGGAAGKNDEDARCERLAAQAIGEAIET